MRNSVCFGIPNFACSDKSEYMPTKPNQTCIVILEGKLDQLSSPHCSYPQSGEGIQLHVL